MVAQSLLHIVCIILYCDSEFTMCCLYNTVILLCSLYLPQTVYHVQCVLYCYIIVLSVCHKLFTMCSMYYTVTLLYYLCFAANLVAWNKTHAFSRCLGVMNVGLASFIHTLRVSQSLIISRGSIAIWNSDEEWQASMSNTIFDRIYFSVIIGLRVLYSCRLFPKFVASVWSPIKVCRETWEYFLAMQESTRGASPTPL